VTREGNNVKRKLLEARPRNGIIHFNGIRPNHISWFDKGTFSYCNDECQNTTVRQELFRQTWGLADYYIYVPWKWARFFAESMIPFNEKGHELVVREITPDIV